MTCIAGINTENKIIIAGDRMGSNGYTYGHYHEKVFRKNDFIYGVCGSYRIMQLIKYKFTPPEMKVGQDIENYIYTDFTDSFIKLVRDNNCALKEDNLDRMEARIIFGFKDRLYQMQGNFQILSDNKGYDAIGSGCYHAIASLYSTKDLDIGPIDRLKKAIICASEFVLSVNNSIDIIELEYKQKKSIKK